MEIKSWEDLKALKNNNSFRIYQQNREKDVTNGIHLYEAKKA